MNNMDGNNDMDVTTFDLQHSVYRFCDSDTESSDSTNWDADDEFGSEDEQYDQRSNQTAKGRTADSSRHISGVSKEFKLLTIGEIDQGIPMDQEPTTESDASLRIYMRDMSSPAEEDVCIYMKGISSPAKGDLSDSLESSSDSSDDDIEVYIAKIRISCGKKRKRLYESCSDNDASENSNHMETCGKKQKM